MTDGAGARTGMAARWAHAVDVRAVVVVILVTAVSILLIGIEGGILFHPEIVAVHGDQRLYYDLARSLLLGEPVKSLYTLGYPLFMVPLIAATGVSPDWRSIMAPLIALQAFAITPASVYLILCAKSARWQAAICALAVLYVGAVLIPSPDPLTKYNLVGLIPLSEPLGVLCLLSVYAIVFAAGRRPSTFAALGAGVVAGFTVLVKSPLALLLVPAVVEAFRMGWRRELAVAALAALAAITPQILYNLAVGGSIRFSGYAWWAEITRDKNARMIEQLYGFPSTAMFSPAYLRVNLSRLAWSWLPLALLAAPLVVTGGPLGKALAIATLVDIAFYLSYWWSAAGGLIDRFLLPNVLLVFWALGRGQPSEPGGSPRAI